MELEDKISDNFELLPQRFDGELPFKIDGQQKNYTKFLLYYWKKNSKKPNWNPSRGYRKRESLMNYFQVEKGKYMKNYIMFILTFMLISSCANLTRERSSFEMCLDCLHYKNFVNGISWCTKATTEDSNNYHAYNYLSICYYVQKDTTKALKSLDKAILIKPDNYLSWNLKAKILKDQGKDYESSVCRKKAYELELKEKNEGK